MRLFFGIEIPPYIKQNILEFQSLLMKAGVKANWKRVENLHLTLEFLGDYNEDKVPVLCDVLSEVAKNHKSFKLKIKDLGAFPSFKRPHTLWSGFSGDTENLMLLQNELHQKLLNNNFKLENRVYKPHLTLASRPDVRSVGLTDFKNILLGEFLVDKLILFESKAENGKRIYTNVCNAGLK
ncbi:MAG: RNA 2',3'-cyclic phosphodiesterase [Bacteroidota bacterium]